MKATIIGAGVSGLTTGIVLLEAGHDVKIITADLPDNTTSAKAAAIWFPYAVYPKDKANAWSKYAYGVFQDLCEDSNSGISMVDVTVLIEKEEDAWWKGAFPASAIHLAPTEQLPQAYPLAYIANVPLIETQIYLDYLLQRFQKRGGTLAVERVENIHSLVDHNDWVINCSGLGARELVNDQEMYPIQGQLVKIEKQANAECIIADFAFGEKEQDLAYVVVRQDCLVLGGTSVKKAEAIQPAEAVTAGIIERCKLIAPTLKEVDIKKVEVGLRPGRPEIRLAQEGRIIHNYGHGGGGYTVSWGCAQEVLAWL
ncbi:MAG: FAD-dependent oxidoreductase [Bacteroidota bacterium]